MPGRRRARPAIRRGGPVRLPSWPPRTSPRADAGGARRVDPGARHAGPEARARLRRSSRGFPRAPRTRGTPARASPRRDASPRRAVAAPARMAGEASPITLERPLRSWSIEPRIRQGRYQYGSQERRFLDNNLRRFGGGGATKATTRRFDCTLAPAAQHASAHERRPPRVSRGSAQQKHGRRTPRSLERSEPSSLVVTARRRRARFICARGARRDTRVRSAHSVS